MLSFVSRNAKNKNLSLLGEAIWPPSVKFCCCNNPPITFLNACPRAVGWPRAVLSPRRHLATSGDLFWCHDSEDAAGFWWGETRDAPQHPTLPRTAPHNQALTIQPQMAVVTRLRSPALQKLSPRWMWRGLLWGWVYLFVSLRNHSAVCESMELGHIKTEYEIKWKEMYSMADAPYSR